MQTKIVQNIKSIIIAIVLLLVVGTVSATSTWTGPTAVAPGANTDTPINVGSSSQVKTGLFTIDHLITGDLQIPTGAGAGKVLTSSATGVASWGTGAVATDFKVVTSAPSAACGGLGIASCPVGYKAIGGTGFSTDTCQCNESYTLISRPGANGTSWEYAARCGYHDTAVVTCVK